MKNLSFTNKSLLEKYLEMQSGYVLDFTDRTFGLFVVDSVGVDIHDEKYQTHGTSKANKLRTFLQVESESLCKKLLSDICEYWQSKDRFIKSDTDVKSFLSLISSIDGDEFVGEIQETLKETEGNIGLLAEDIKRLIREGHPELALDRLHTYLVNILRSACDKNGILYDKNKPLHSLWAELMKSMRSKGKINSDATDIIAKSNISILEKFNFVRNQQSAAHDNPLLGTDESLFIVRNIVSLIRLLNAIN
jgi:hypothetical protein